MREPKKASKTCRVKTTKIKGLENKEVECKSKKTPKHPKHLFPLHTLGLFVGNVGCGKTNAVSLLTSEYFERESFNRLFILSPTYDQNEPLKVLKADPEDIYQDRRNALGAVEEITFKVKKMADDYELEKRYKRIYKRYQKGKASFNDKFILAQQKYRKPPKKIVFPSPCLIIDDMSHSNLYVSSIKNDFTNLVLRHRHLHGLGLTIFMLVQTFNTGAQKALRQQGRQFFIFPTHDYSQLESMYKTLASNITYDEFISIYKKAIKGSKHNFLTIDMRAEDENKMFRRNFDEFLTVDSITNGNESDENEGLGGDK